MPSACTSVMRLACCHVISTVGPHERLKRVRWTRLLVLDAFYGVHSPKGVTEIFPVHDNRLYLHLVLHPATNPAIRLFAVRAIITHLGRLQSSRIMSTHGNTSRIHGSLIRTIACSTQLKYVMLPRFQEHAWGNKMLRLCPCSRQQAFFC